MTNDNFKNNGRETAVNRAIDGSTYTSKKLWPSSLRKKNLVDKKHNNLYLGLVMPYSG
jgi:hypothetical protein